MRHVLALAEHGSFARAAVALHLSQPALSRSIQSVERHVGSELFLRRGGRCRADRHRAAADPRARQIAALSEDLDRGSCQDRSLEVGPRVIGGGPYPAQSTCDRADAIHRHHPRITVRVHAGMGRAAEPLRTREIGLFVAESSTMQQEPTSTSSRCPRIRCTSRPAQGHPLATCEPTSRRRTFRVSVRCPESNSAPAPRAPAGRAAQVTGPGRSPARLPFARMQRDGGDQANGRGSDAIWPRRCLRLPTELESGQLTILRGEPWLSTHYGLVKLEGPSAQLRLGGLPRIRHRGGSRNCARGATPARSTGCRPGGRAGSARRRRPQAQATSAGSAPPPVGDAFVGMCDREKGRLGERTANELEAGRQAVIGEAARAPTAPAAPGN